MRKLLNIFVLLVCFCQSLSWSQISFSNKTPFTAMNVCFPQDSVKITSLQNFDQYFNVSGTNQCQGGTTKLYYTFNNAYTYNTNDLIIGVTFAGSYTLKLHGPFSEFLSGASQVAAGTSNVFYSGSHSGAYNLIGAIGVGETYILEVTVSSCSGSLNVGPGLFVRYCNSNAISPCEDCIPTFSPKDKRFVVSAWVSQGSEPNKLSTFQTPAIIVTVNGNPTPFIFSPRGQIIDGWQRIEGVFQSNSTGDISLQFKAGTEASYFDDVRIFPDDGSMMTYVYDPVTMRLVAELDERNYAKIYEYDEEGKLVRVKKETVEGIMTIQENRENSHLKPAVE